MLRGAQVSVSNLGYSISPLLIRYAISEGGDSLLDSEEERDVIPDVAALLPVHQSLPVEKETPTTESFPLPSDSLSPPPTLLPDNLLSRCRDESGRPKVIRLDRRKSECVMVFHHHLSFSIRVPMYSRQLACRTPPQTIASSKEATYSQTTQDHKAFSAVGGWKGMDG
jgi:hypothetical protein